MRYTTKHRIKKFVDPECYQKHEDLLEKRIEYIRHLLRVSTLNTLGDLKKALIKNGFICLIIEENKKKKKKKNTGDVDFVFYIEHRISVYNITLWYKGGWLSKRIEKKLMDDIENLKLIELDIYMISALYFKLVNELIK